MWYVICGYYTYIECRHNRILLYMSNLYQLITRNSSSYHIFIINLKEGFSEQSALFFSHPPFFLIYKFGRVLYIAYIRYFNEMAQM